MGAGIRGLTPYGRGSRRQRSVGVTTAGREGCNVQVKGVQDVISLVLIARAARPDGER